MLEASTGSYYVVVKHRNHLAVMSADPVSFNNRFVSYDFTTNAAISFMAGPTAPSNWNWKAMRGG